MVVGGGEGLGGHLERKRVKHRVFHAEERMYKLQISLSKIQLLALITTFRAEHNFFTDWNCVDLAKRIISLGWNYA